LIRARRDPDLDVGVEIAGLAVPGRVRATIDEVLGEIVGVGDGGRDGDARPGAVEKIDELDRLRGFDRRRAR
jgi:hypothetical protein